MAGERPALVLKAKAKGAPGGAAAQYIELGAAWKSDRGFGHNLVLAPGVTIRLADGSQVVNGTHWMSIFENKNAAPGGTSAKHTAPAEGDPRPATNAAPPRNDDLPF